MSLLYYETKFTLECKSVTIVEGNAPYMNVVVCKPEGKDELLVVIKDGNVEKLNLPLLEKLVKGEVQLEVSMSKETEE